MRLFKGNKKKQRLSLQLNKSTPSTEGWQSMLQMPSTSQDQLQDQYNDMIQFCDGKWWTGSRSVSRVSDVYNNTAQVGIHWGPFHTHDRRPGLDQTLDSFEIVWLRERRFSIWGLGTTRGRKINLRGHEMMKKKKVISPALNDLFIALWYLLCFIHAAHIALSTQKCLWSFLKFWTNIHVFQMTYPNQFGHPLAFSVSYMHHKVDFTVFCETFVKLLVVLTLCLELISKR